MNLLERAKTAGRWLKRQAVLTTLGLAYDVRINKDSLEQIQPQLQTSQNRIVCFNHLALDDGPMAFYANGRYLDPRGKQHLVAVASHWQTDPKNKPEIALAAKVARSFLGAEIIRVVQTYQVNNPKYPYTEIQARQTYKDLILRMHQIKKNGQPTTVIISPEGHRSEDGQLQKPETGIKHLGDLLSPVVYLPLIFSYPDGYDRNHLNTRRPFKRRRIGVTFGKPILQHDRSDSPSLDKLMGNLSPVEPILENNR